MWPYLISEAFVSLWLMFSSIHEKPYELEVDELVMLSRVGTSQLKLFGNVLVYTM